MNSLRYKHGAKSQWIAVLRSQRLLAIKGRQTEAQVATWWQLLGSDGGVQAVLDEIVSAGLSSAPSFALLEWHSESSAVHAIVRGEAAVALETASGSLTLDATGVSTWIERRIDGVSGFELRPEVVLTKAEDAAPALPLESGAVAFAVLSVGTVAEVQPVVAPPVEAEVAPEPEPAPDPEPAPAPEPRPEPVPAPPVVPAPAPTPVVAAPVAVSESTMVERTAVEAEEAPAAPPAVEAPALAVDDMHDGETIMQSDLAALRAARRAQRAQPAPVSGPVPVLRSSAGVVESLDGPLIVGRAPSVSKVSAGDIPRLLTISGSDQDISRNHVRFAVQGGTVVVTDMHSRNGTQVRQPGRPAANLRPGEATPIIVGTVVDLGGGVTFTVEEQ